MEYRKFDKTIVVRLDPGEEILEKIKEVAEKENVKLAKVEALGATNDFTIGAYSIPEKKYYKTDYKGVWEIVSLHGNISTKDGEFYSHIHMGCGDNEGHFVGGHLNRAVISATCEMFITIIDGKVDRMVDEKTGLNVFKFI